MKKNVTANVVLLVSLSLAFGAQDTIDKEATEKIREYTTDPQYLTSLVDYLPYSATVPAPQEVLGYVTGKPEVLTYYKDIMRYFRALDAASERVSIFEAGRSHQGNTMIAVAVTDEENLKNLNHFVGLLKELSDPRKTSESRMKEILAEGKPVYLFTGGLHSTETGSPEMLMEMAYRLAVSETESISRIRKEVITLIVPVLEMDGRDRMVDWYYRHTRQAPTYEEIPRSSPPFWGDYTFHDNNRDGIMVSQPLSKNINDVYFRFYPLVTHDLHESVPLLYISTGTGPYYTSYNPIVKSEWQWFAFNEVTQLTRMGVPGVWSWGFYTGWYPGYVLWIGTNHNAIGRFYETFGNAGANTYERTISDTPGKGRTSEEWYRPSPPPAKTLWSLRNNTNLMQSGCLVALDFTARHADAIMESFWTKGRNAVRAGAVEKPHAWILPLDQPDLFTAKRLLSTLKTHGIEIHQLTADLKIEETTYKQGSLVVRMDQPYRNFAKTLLEVQEWPENSETRPYDSTAWTLGLMLGVETIKVNDKKILDASMSSVSENPFGGIVEGASGWPLLAPPQGNAMIAALLSLKDTTITVVDEEFSVDARVFPPGTWVLAEETAKVAEVCRDIGLKLYSSAGAKLPPTRPLKLPRLAMYCGWFSTQSAGWARWTLDEIGIPWTWITRDRIRAGNLEDDFDVIIIPDHDRRTEGRDFLRGVDERHGSLAFDKTEEFQYLGSPIAAAKTTGGLGFEGLFAIEKFVQEGGTLITLGSGSTLVTDFGLLSGAERESSDKLVCPGTIVSSWVRQRQNPIVYGYEEHPGFYRTSLPLFTVDRHMRKYVVAQFGTKLPKDVENELSDEEKEAYEKRKEVKLLRSGLLKNGEALDGTAAIVDAPAGEGRIVMFAFNPFYRWMSHSAFPLVYNAIMHWNAPAEIREEKGAVSNQ